MIGLLIVLTVVVLCICLFLMFQIIPRLNKVESRVGYLDLVENKVEEENKEVN